MGDVAPEQHDPIQAARESLQRAEAIFCSQLEPSAPRLLSNTICYLGTLVLTGWAITHGHAWFAIGFFILAGFVVLKRRRL